MKMTKDVFEKLIAHAKKDNPIEACGYLAAENGIVNTLIPLRNADQSEKHFSFNPTEQFNAVREMRDLGLTAAAVYHSHPKTPARPSDEDKRLAFDSSVNYVIVSLAGIEPEIKSFRIHKEHVVTEEIKIVK